MTEIRRRLVVALGGNALLRRGELPTIENQRSNARLAAEALAPLTRNHDLVITHGNGPQIGFLALQQETDVSQQRMPLDVLGAESEGLIGYLLELELRRALPSREIATLLTLVQVDSEDGELDRPTKPIGPVYDAQEWRQIARETGWQFVRDGDGWRRAVPSPMPVRILQQDIVTTLLDRSIIPICAGGGGVPVTIEGSEGPAGVEAVIDKDWTSARLAADLGAGMLVMLTDVDSVYIDWGRPNAVPLESISADQAKDLDLPDGSIGPKVAAALWFVAAGGRTAAIGSLSAASDIVAGKAGTHFR
jgi:carbamate kinase